MRQKGCKYGVLGWKSCRKETLEKAWHKRRDNIKMDHKEINCEYLEYTHVAPDKDQIRTYVTARVPSNAREFFTYAHLTFLRTGPELRV
jgi:hypothetical protein